MIIVFSNVAPGASLMYLILYLPISTVSLFCNNCFLTALPLTYVPLVLFRSSRWTSLPVICSTACSPLTARLSMTMSL